MPNRFYIAAGGLQADGCFIECDEYTGKAQRIERIQLKISL
jgi:calcineurin-like phosphoesterase